MENENKPHSKRHFNDCPHKNDPQQLIKNYKHKEIKKNQEMILTSHPAWKRYIMNYEKTKDHEIHFNSDEESDQKSVESTLIPEDDTTINLLSQRLEIIKGKISNFSPAIVQKPPTTEIQIFKWLTNEDTIDLDQKFNQVENALDRLTAWCGQLILTKQGLLNAEKIEITKHNKIAEEHLKALIKDKNRKERYIMCCGKKQCKFKYLSYAHKEKIKNKVTGFLNKIYVKNCIKSTAFFQLSVFALIFILECAKINNKTERIVGYIITIIELINLFSFLYTTLRLLLSTMYLKKGSVYMLKAYVGMVFSFAGSYFALRYAEGPVAFSGLLYSNLNDMLTPEAKGKDDSLFIKSIMSILQPNKIVLNENETNEEERIIANPVSIFIDLLYFSSVVMAKVGYGDVRAQTLFAKLLVFAEIQCSCFMLYILFRGISFFNIIADLETESQRVKSLLYGYMAMLPKLLNGNDQTNKAEIAEIDLGNQIAITEKEKSQIETIIIPNESERTSISGPIFRQSFSKQKSLEIQLQEHKLKLKKIDK